MVNFQLMALSIAVVAAQASTVASIASCGVYLAPSFLEGVGRGLYAGRDYNDSEVIDSQTAVTIPYEYIWEVRTFDYWQLWPLPSDMTSHSSWN